MSEDDGMILDLSGDVEDVEKSCIVSSTRAGYLLTLCAFMGFLLDTAPVRLKDDVRQALETADAKDKALVNPRTKARRPNLYAAAKLELNKMTRTDDGSTSPIILKGTQQLTYADIASFMGTKKKKVTVSSALAQRSRQGSAPAVAPAATVPAAVAVPAAESSTTSAFVRCSDSTYNAIRNAVTFLYTESNNIVPSDMKTSLSRYAKGSKRLSRKLKQNLGLKLTEGKAAMSKKVYTFLAQYLFKSRKQEHIFAHMFLILDW